MRAGHCKKKGKAEETEQKEQVNMRSVLLCTADGDIIKRYTTLKSAVCGIKQSHRYGWISAVISCYGFYWTDATKTEKLVKEYPQTKRKRT